VCDAVGVPIVTIQQDVLTFPHDERIAATLSTYGAVKLIKFMPSERRAESRELRVDDEMWGLMHGAIR
jgi:hypothetical protein